MAVKLRYTPSQKEPSSTSLFLAIIVILAICIFMFSDLFKVENITVTGNSRLSGEEIIIFAGLDTPINFFQIDENEIRKKLNKHRLIKECIIKKRFPRTIEISVTEREPFFLLPYGQQSDLLVISKDFFIISIYDPRLDHNLPIVTGIQVENLHLGSQLNASYLPDVKYILNGVNPELLRKISEIHFHKEGQISIIINTSCSIEIGTDQDLAHKIRNLNLLVQQRKLNKGKVFLQDPEHPVISEK